MPTARSTSTTLPGYGDWIAPKHDGALLIWPAADSLAEVAQRNHANLTGERSLAEQRESMRRYLGIDPDRLLIATGHQCELHHPGVWVKTVLVDAIARKAEASTLYLALDTDSPKHLKLKWPGFAAPLSDDPSASGAAWTGLIDPPLPSHLQRLSDAAHAAAEQGDVGEALPKQLDHFRAFLVDQRDAIAPLDLPAVLAESCHWLDWQLDLDYALFTASGLFESPGWIEFARHMAADAAGFAAVYNASLAAYRTSEGITDPERPMPDLAMEQDRIELPFWLDDLEGGVRHRASVRRDGSAWMIEHPGRADDAFLLEGNSAALLAWLRARRLRMSSRALSLTLFLRLFVVDLFIHGIGGAHYDQVTDAVIRDYFDIEPPTFAVATATLLHPHAAGREPVCMPCLKRRGHRLAHDALGEEKKKWIARIEAAGDFHARRTVFEAMHEARRQAMQTDPALETWRAEVEQAMKRQSEEAVLFDRELFYAIQPEARLRDLIDRVRQAVAGR